MVKLIIFDLDDTLYDRFGQLDETYRNLPNIKLFDDAIYVLKSVKVPKILVSFGDYAIQQKKIEVLGLRKYFDEVDICATIGEKKKLFEGIVKKFRIKDPKEVVVVGDRIDSELRFGKMLGFVTIRLIWGKYKDLKPKDEYEVPDHTIKKLSEVLVIIK